MDRVSPKILLVLFAALCGFAVFRGAFQGSVPSFVGIVVGFCVAIAALMFEERASRAGKGAVTGGSIGLVVGLACANIISYPIVPVFLEEPLSRVIAYVFFNGIFGYAGLSIGVKKGEDFDAAGSRTEAEKNVFIVDTSVLIDGRIADLCATGFIDGSFVIPRFVTEELHYIAESADPAKKARGVRGIEMLEALQKDKNLDVRIAYEEMPEVKQVDMKLVALAKKFGARMLTNDVNLTRVAKLHDVRVLSINMLAAALKPVVIPGEVLSILLQKTGKEHGQAVGYIDDGTMVVVDHCAQFIGKNVDVTVTSILQTTTGRMIFAKLSDQPKHITLAGETRQ